MLPNLINIRLYPPSLNVTANPEIFGAVTAEVRNDEPAFGADGVADTAADNIDWDITLESTDIDWDIGTVETEDNGNGLGPYEIVSANDALPNSPHKDGVETHQALENMEGAAAQDVSLSDISWDISVENPLVGGVEDAGLTSTPTDSGSFYHFSKTEATGGSQERSQLMETEYRNKILDDLFEVNTDLVLHLTMSHCSPVIYLLLFC